MDLYCCTSNTTSTKHVPIEDVMGDHHSSHETTKLSPATTKSSSPSQRRRRNRRRQQQPRRAKSLYGSGGSKLNNKSSWGNLELGSMIVTEDETATTTTATTNATWTASDNKKENRRRNLSRSATAPLTSTVTHGSKRVSSWADLSVELNNFVTNDEEAAVAASSLDVPSNHSKSSWAGLDIFDEIETDELLKGYQPPGSAEGDDDEEDATEDATEDDDSVDEFGGDEVEECPPKKGLGQNPCLDFDLDDLSSDSESDWSSDEEEDDDEDDDEEEEC